MEEYVEIFKEYKAVEMNSNSRKQAIKRISEDFSKLLGDILEASNNGVFSLSYGKSLSVFEEELLKALGYEVFNTSYVTRRGFTNYVVDSYKISWHNVHE